MGAQLAPAVARSFHTHEPHQVAAAWAPRSVGAFDVHATSLRPYDSKRSDPDHGLQRQSSQIDVKTHHHRQRLCAQASVAESVVLPPATGSALLPIRPFLAGRAFQPETLQTMSAAFEAVCEKLGLAIRHDAATAAVAKFIVELAQTGVHDFQSLFEATMAKFGSSPE
jgi:hypothetical protein